VWLYHRFCLSFREVDEILAEGGATVTFETVIQRSLDLTMPENSKIAEALCPKQFLPEG
jgi:transposase-like protein